MWKEMFDWGGSVNVDFLGLILVVILVACRHLKCFSIAQELIAFDIEFTSFRSDLHLLREIANFYPISLEFGLPTDVMMPSAIIYQFSIVS